STPIARLHGASASMAGHSARIAIHNERTAAEAAVELLPTTLPRPVLSASVVADGLPGLDNLLRRALAGLLPHLLPDGPTTPTPDAAGRLTLPPTTPVPTARLSDLPVPAQVLTLCTTLLKHTSPTPPASAVEAIADEGATCRWSAPEPVSASLLSGPGTTKPMTEIAGHPAHVSPGKITVTLDDRALLVLYRPTAEPDTLRTWATH